MTKVTARRTNADWAHFLNDFAERYPDAKRVTLVMDNLNIHRPGALYLMKRHDMTLARLVRPILSRRATARSSFAGRHHRHDGADVMEMPARDGGCAGRVPGEATT